MRKWKKQWLVECFPTDPPNGKPGKVHYDKPREVVVYADSETLARAVVLRGLKGVTIGNVKRYEPEPIVCEDTRKAPGS